MKVKKLVRRLRGLKADDYSVIVDCLDCDLFLGSGRIAKISTSSEDRLVLITVEMQRRVSHHKERSASVDGEGDPEELEI